MSIASHRHAGVATQVGVGAGGESPSPTNGWIGYKGNRTIDFRGTPWPWRRPTTTRSSRPTPTPAPTTRRTASTSTREFLDDFDAWRDKYKNPWKDLRDTDLRVRNWDDDRRDADQLADGVVGEVIFPNTVPPFYPGLRAVRRPAEARGVRAPPRRHPRAQPLAGRLLRPQARRSAPASARSS